MNQYVVVLISDSCDPEVYGPFSSEDKAEGFLKQMQKVWTERDWYHYGDESQVVKMVTNGVDQLTRPLHRLDL